MTWEEHIFDNIISHAAKKSKDPSTKVGCAIVDKSWGIVSLAFNGFPRGVEDDPQTHPFRYERPAKYLWTVHAEMNAILMAAQRGIPDDCKILVKWWPCNNCAAAIIQAGIRTVILDGDSKEFNDPMLAERWRESQNVAKSMFDEAGVEVMIYKRVN